PILGGIGDLARSLGAREVLVHVACESAQASVGREEKRVTARIAQTLGDVARLLEELVRLALLHAGQTADLEQRDTGGELERQGFWSLRKTGKELRDPPAVSRPVRWIAPCDPTARMLVPSRRLERLTRLIELVREERRVRR